MSKTLLLIPLLLVASCGQPTGVDAGIDARIDVGRPDANLDANRDAYRSDADLPRAESVWRNPTPPDCSRFVNNPPRWAPTTPAGEVGVPRWVVPSNDRAFGLAVTWDQPPPTRASLFGPVLTGTGSVLWTFSDFFDIGLDYASGRPVHFGTSANTVNRSQDPESYTRFPRMWLPPRNAVYWANGWGGRPLREPTFTSDDGPGGRYDFINALGMTGDPPISGIRGRDQNMPSWSTATGDIATAASTGSEGVVIAGCDAGLRWATAVPLVDHPNTALFVRENGEVVVGTPGSVHILDGETGEPRRAGLTGAVTSTDYGFPVTYQPGCGLLIEKEIAMVWYWYDVDRMEQGPLLGNTVRRMSGTRSWSGTADCGLVQNTDFGIIRYNADGSVRYDRPAPPGTAGTLVPPIPLADGGTAMILPGGWYRIAPDGALSEVTRVAPESIGFTSVSEPILAPDGTLFYLSEAGASAIPTGLLPGPYLWPRSGLNWARTNSILPD